jgi:UDP-N-acetylmuramoyl-L-alanyl-D-glutamate--2,6-diaminopimelate ligase
MATVHQLFAGLGETITGADVEAASLVYDSRRATPGACFAALPGARADGHAFVPQALAGGATSVVCERPVDCGRATRILVPDARLALATAARRFHGDPAARLVMVGVTGTNGKTTTTHVIEAILAAAGQRPAIIGTLGHRFEGDYVTTGLTTPESVDLVALVRALAERGATAVAMEASSHALHQHRVAGVDYDVGVFTNLTHDHLDYHGTLEAYFEAKAILFRERLKAGGRAVVNFDDAYGRKLAGPGVLFFSAAGDAGAGLRVQSQKLSGGGTELELVTPAGPLHLTSPLVGRFNVENVLAAVGVGLALGLAPAVITRGVAAVGAVPGRLERVSGAGQPLVVVDYAHTPDALEKVLRAVRGITPGRVYCVFGCGGDRDPKKRAPMGELAARLADWSVLTSDNPRSESPAAIAAAVEAGLKQGGAVPSDAPAAGGYRVELDRARAIRLAIGAARPGDAVVVAGKGHETYQIVGGETRHFDDREEARAALLEGSAVPVNHQRDEG